MSRPIRISFFATSQQAQALLDLVEREHTFFMHWPLRKALRRALEPKRKAPDAAGMALAANLRARANATRRAFGLRPLASKPRKPSKQEKRESRAEIRRKVFERATVDGVARCEGPGGQLHPKMAGQVRCGNSATQLAHAFGRGKGRRPESERNCMALCDSCAYMETHNQPTAAFWWDFRAAFFADLGYYDEAGAARRRALFVETRASLPAAPRTRHD